MLWGVLTPEQGVTSLGPRSTSSKLHEHSVTRREASGLFSYKT